MKKFLKSIAVLTLFATTAAMATEPKIDLKTGNESKSLILEMDAASGTSEIRMTDSNDNLVHYETIAKSSYAKKFNLKDLENGTYYFTVGNPLKKVVYTITLGNKEIKIANKRESPKIQVLRKSGDRIYFNLLNMDQGTVRVRVLNGGGEPLESQVFKGDTNVGKVYNFENALKDNYMVVVNDGKSVYRQSISVK
jgi:cell division protein YceG involved in septum cleavage